MMKKKVITFSSGEKVDLYLYIYTYTLYIYTCIHTYLTYIRVSPYSTSLPPSLSPLLHTFYYDIHIQPGILIGQSPQNSSKRYIRLALVSQPELQFNRSTAPPSRPQELLKRERETCLINAQTFFVGNYKVLYVLYLHCVHSVHGVQYCAIKARQEGTGPERNGSDQQSYYRFRFFFLLFRCCGREPIENISILGPVLWTLLMTWRNVSFRNG